MDQYLSQIIVALITSVFSVIIIIIQRKQDKLVDKIDEQTLFIAREKDLKKQLTKKESEREMLIHEIMVLILDTNLHILQNTGEENGSTLSADILSASEKLKNKLNDATDEIIELNKQYEIILNLSEEYEKEYKKRKASKNST